MIEAKHLSRATGSRSDDFDSIKSALESTLRKPARLQAAERALLDARRDRAEKRRLFEEKSRNYVAEPTARNGREMQEVDARAVAETVEGMTRDAAEHEAEPRGAALFPWGQAAIEHAHHHGRREGERRESYELRRRQPVPEDPEGAPHRRDVRPAEQIPQQRRAIAGIEHRRRVQLAQLIEGQRDQRHRQERRALRPEHRHR